ncbi:phosphate ABC transporter permease subunit PstC, partial [Thiopseudomonas sp. 4R-3cl]
MSSTLLAVILLVFMALAYQFGLLRSKQQAAGVARTEVHSRPVYHATWLALCCTVPALALLLLWSLLEPMVIEAWLLADWPDSTVSHDATAR